MKNTAFIKFHQEAGAKIVPFAGYNMPVEYTGINEEHITVRQSIGVFSYGRILGYRPVVFEIPSIHNIKRCVSPF